MLTPTLRLATQIANAYDEIRQQTNSLMVGSGEKAKLDSAAVPRFEGKANW